MLNKAGQPSESAANAATWCADGSNVSVVIPAYNAAKFLAATLQSIENQIARPGEVIVVDDGSTDDTREIAREFGATVIARANGGPSAARNAGVVAANGEYIAFLDADDVWVPQKLALQLTALHAYGKPAFSFSDYRMFDDRGPHGTPSILRGNAAFRKIVGRAIDRSEIVIANDGEGPILYDSYIPPSVCVIRRADYLAVGGFDEQLRAAEDYDLWLRLFRIVPAVVVMKPLTLYRQHPGQATSANATRMRSAFFDVAARVAAAPNRYRRGDADFIAQTEYLREYRLGIHQSRIGQFDGAAQSFERSLAARWTLAANAAMVGSRIARSQGGRSAIEAARTLWKRRPGKR